MTFEDSMMLTKAVEIIHKLQDEGKVAGTVSVGGWRYDGGKHYHSEVFMVSTNTTAGLPVGEISYTPRNCDQYPWEASVTVNNIKYYALIPADECWKLYLDFAA